MTWWVTVFRIARFDGVAGAVTVNAYLTVVAITVCWMRFWRSAVAPLIGRDEAGIDECVGFYVNKRKRTLILLLHNHGENMRSLQQGFHEKDLGTNDGESIIQSFEKANDEVLLMIHLG